MTKLNLVKGAPIGVFGGTFDPVHFAHLRTALELLEQYSLQEIRFIPCKSPVHKPNALASEQDRLAMLQLAIQHQPHFVIDQRELERDTPSYMYLTLESLREDFPNNPLCLILGLDAFLGLPNWYKFEELLQLCHILVVDREGSKIDLSTHWFTSYITTNFTSCRQQLAGQVYFAKTTHLAISATQIRQLIQSKQNPSYLLPDAVFEYIQSQKLYGA